MDDIAIRDPWTGKPLPKNCPKCGAPVIWKMELNNAVPYDPDTGRLHRWKGGKASARQIARQARPRTRASAVVD